MIKVYGIKTCGSVKKAMAFFKDHEISYEFIDFKKENMDEQKISFWIEKTDINQLFNNKGTKYRTLKLKDLNLDNSGKKEWLIKENMLIKRPVIEFGEDVIVAYDEEIYKDKFLK
jgi:Spx/MgsR family transcriptional regulator